MRLCQRPASPIRARASIPTAEPGDELVARTVTIDRPRQELYAFWRDFRNLPLFMENIQSVTVIDELRSHWVVRAPADRTVEWDAVITEDEPGAAIAWASTDDASVRNSGRIEFRDSTNGRGTEVTATIVYDPPAGGLGKLDRQAVSARAEDSGAAGPAALQAAHGDRRDRHRTAPGGRAARAIIRPIARGPFMRALTWHGKEDVRVETVPDPKIVNPRDAIIGSRPRPSAARTCISTTTTSRR